MSRPRKATGRAMKAGETIPSARRPSTPSNDISESFRTARSALGQITTDLEQLRRHASSMVKSAKRRAAN